MHLLEDIKQRRSASETLLIYKCCVTGPDWGFCLRPAHFTSQPIILQLYLHMHCSPQLVLHLSVLSPTFPSFPIPVRSDVCLIVIPMGILPRHYMQECTVCARHSFSDYFPSCSRQKFIKSKTKMEYEKKTITLLCIYSF